MTKPRYLPGCSAWSQVRGDASPDASDPDYAWNVNFNNGNANLNNRNNHAFARAVRVASAREYQGATAQELPTLRVLYQAWQRARRKKRPSNNQVAFETRWIDHLLDMQAALSAGTWEPAPALCFIACRPKAREIHAPAFADRVVHHWIVPQLEAIYERTFIDDSFSNRVGKGTHAAVRRVRDLARQVHSGEGGGWYLQLDIRNFFNSIHRPTLYALLKRRMQREHTPMPVQQAVHALLRRPLHAQGVQYRSTTAERARVPAHKRLENAPPGCGIPIGNLSSQFFANVYLDRLDQFVKHTLRAKRYVRYVDDFVLFHHDRSVLEGWREKIVAFLRDTLRLELKAEQRLQRIDTGIDFLGYIVRPTHSLVRPRVVTHATAALEAWQRGHVRGRTICAAPVDLGRIASVWRSYLGHFEHAAARRLTGRFIDRFPWLPAATRSGRRFPPRAMRRAVTLTWSTT